MPPPRAPRARTFWGRGGGAQRPVLWAWVLEGTGEGGRPRRRRGGEGRGLMAVGAEQWPGGVMWAGLIARLGGAWWRELGCGWEGLR